MERIRMAFKSSKKRKTVLNGELAKSYKELAKTDINVEYTVESIDSFDAISKSDKSAEGNKTRTGVSIVNPVNDTADEKSELPAMLNNDKEQVKERPQSLYPEIDYFEIGGEMSYITSKRETGETATVELAKVLDDECILHAMGNSKTLLSLESSDKASTSYDFDVKGTVNVIGETFSNSVSTQNENEKHVKVASVTAATELKGKSSAEAEVDALTINDKMQGLAEADVLGIANITGADIKTCNDDGYNASFKIGHTKADFKANVKVGAVSGSQSGLEAIAGGGIEVSLIEGNFAHKDKQELRKLTPENDEEENATWEKGVKLNAESQTSGLITVFHATGNLKCSVSTEESYFNPDEKHQHFDIAIADANIAQQSKCTVKANALYTDRRIETETDRKRAIKMNAKADASVTAISAGHAKINILGNEAAKIEYQTKFEGDGTAEFKGYEKAEISTPTCYAKQLAVCTMTVDGKLKGQAAAGAVIDVLKYQAELEAEANVQGETNAHFTLAEAKMTHEKGHTSTLGFRVMDGKAEGEGKVDGKAVFGKLGIGFEAEANGEAECCAAKGNVELTNKGAVDANLTVGKANAKGKATFGINTKIHGKKFERKFEVSGAVKAPGLDAKNIRSLLWRPLPKLLSDVSSLAKVQVKQIK